MMQTNNKQIMGYEPSVLGMQPFGMQPPHQPIVNQPTGDRVNFLNEPFRPMNCPPGLEYLTTIDQIFIKQKIDQDIKFIIQNSLGQQVYYAVEDNDCCTRTWCGTGRPFDMKVFDDFKNEVIHLCRPLTCCLQSIEVSTPPGNIVGTVEEEWSVWHPHFAVKNHMGETVLRIEGPVCTSSLCGDVEFKILTLKRQQIGKISKQWPGLLRELFTNADFFGFNFPLDLEVRMKATLLGACFLIHVMYYENNY